MKQKIGNQNVLYPMPITLVGALVNGRVNFCNIAHVGILNAASPHLISLGMGKVHYTNQGIKEHRAFSVNLPSQDMVVEADYVGLVSGKAVDKSAVFEVFYGELPAAPMIKNCPLSMECKLYDIVNTPTHEVFIGEVVGTYADSAVLKGGKVDLAKVRPLLFDMSSREYWSLGQPVAKCWDIGKKLKPAK
jgi:flavin reductase (DIM6/NTAB) family NADH-FMN oxidoreductase RutF